MGVVFQDFKLCILEEDITSLMALLIQAIESAKSDANVSFSGGVVNSYRPVYV